VVKFQHRLINKKPTDPDLVASAQWRPRSRIRPLTSLRLYPSYFLAWTQVRYMQVRDAEVDQFDLWDRCEGADLFNAIFSKAAHAWEIPLMVRRLKPKPLRAPNPSEARLDYYVDLRDDLSTEEKEALTKLAGEVAHANNLLHKLEFRDTKDGISVCVDES
jgi:hypothetical protein